MPEQPTHTFLFAVMLLIVSPVMTAGAAPSMERQAELRNLLHQDCGSCHGMRLTGGLGPALTVDALAGKPRELLVSTVRDGRAGTPMPPWKQQLSDSDIQWLVDLLLDPEVAQ